MLNGSRKNWNFRDGFGISLHTGKLPRFNRRQFDKFVFLIEIKGNEWAPLILIPLLAAIMLVASVLLLIIFRQHPSLVITTVAGCLVVVTIYLTFSAVGNVDVTYA